MPPVSAKAITYPVWLSVALIHAAMPNMAPIKRPPTRLMSIGSHRFAPSETGRTVVPGVGTVEERLTVWCFGSRSSGSSTMAVLSVAGEFLGQRSCLILPLRGGEDWLRWHCEAPPPYWEDGSTPPLDLIHMCISPWYQFRLVPAWR